MKKYQFIFFFFVSLLVLPVKGQENLVLYWSFDTLQNQIFYDISGNGNSGTTYGPKLIAGVKGKALSFDGVDDFAASPGKDQFPPGKLSELGEGAISLWFKVEHIPEENGIAPLFYYGSEAKCDFFDAANQGLIIEVGHSPVHYQSKRLYFTIWKNGCTLPSFCFDSNIAINENEWYHIVVVVGEDFNTGYLNGEEMTNRYYNFGTSSYSQFFEDAVIHEKLWLGKGHWDRTTQYLKGAIDELRIYGNAISAEKVRELYNEVANPTSSAAKKHVPEVHVFPNPSDGWVNISRGSGGQLKSLQVIDFTGKTVLKENEPADRLDISHLSHGTYYLKLNFADAIYHEVIMVR